MFHWVLNTSLGIYREDESRSFGYSLIFTYFNSVNKNVFKSSNINTRKNCMLEKLLLNLDNRRNYGICSMLK